MKKYSILKIAFPVQGLWKKQMEIFYLQQAAKELSVFVKFIDKKERLYARVLPGIESLQLCMDCGIAGRQILALQGPFLRR